MRTHRRWGLLLSLLAAGASLAANQRGAAAQLPRGYTLRFALVAITPNGPDATPPGRFPEFLEKMNSGSTLRLGPTPAAFVKKLELADQHFSSRLVSAGSPLFGLGNIAHVEAKPGAASDYEFRIDDTIEIVIDDGKTLGVHRRGGASFRLPNVNNPIVAGWDVTDSHVTPGLTYPWEAHGLPNGDRLAYLITIMRGDARFAEAK